MHHSTLTTFPFFSTTHLFSTLFAQTDRDQICASLASLFIHPALLANMPYGSGWRRTALVLGLVFARPAAAWIPAVPINDTSGLDINTGSSLTLLYNDPPTTWGTVV